MKQIINSILDTDTYKLTMQQCVYRQYPSATVHYKFVCRNKDVKLGFLMSKVQQEIDAIRNVRLQSDERDYLSGIPFLRPDYINFLSGYRFDPDNQVYVGQTFDGDLEITIGGTWAETILWEVPLLAIVNELYFRETAPFTDELRRVGENRLTEKIELIRQYPRFTLTDFGTRRRYSRKWQEHIVRGLRDCCTQLVGTSNVKLAMDLGVKAVGTVAHEFFSAHLALVDNIAEAQKRALYVWLQEYDTDLGHALTDTFTTKAFFQDFNKTLTNAFQGLRHDSGDPIEFGYKAIEHYKKMGVDPKTKSLVFSDGLDIPKAIQIYKEFTGLIGLGFGVGTNLTNDLGPTPLNIVIKLIECNGKGVAKISDNITKAIGDQDMIARLKTVYGL